MMPLKEAYVRVSGIVQGVGYRWQAVQKAESLGLKGWIRNRPDGYVDAILQGEETAVQDMIDWMKKGPPHAVVCDVSVQWSFPENLFEDFRIRGY